MDFMQHSVTFFSTLELKYANFKADPNTVKYVVHHFVYKRHYLVTKQCCVHYGAP